MNQVNGFKEIDWNYVQGVLVSEHNFDDYLLLLSRVYGESKPDKPCLAALVLDLHQIRHLMSVLVTASSHFQFDVSERKTHHQIIETLEKLGIVLQDAVIEKIE